MAGESCFVHLVPRYPRDVYEMLHVLFGKFKVNYNNLSVFSFFVVAAICNTLACLVPYAQYLHRKLSTHSATFCSHGLGKRGGRL